MVYQKTGDTRTAARDHPLYRMLHDSPNFDQTSVDFWQFMQSSLEFWGNAYAEKIITNGIVSALVPVSPSMMNVKRLQNGSIEYTWTHEGQNYTRTDADMLHIRGFGGNPLGGMSTLHFGKNAFGLARAVDRAAGSTFKNGLRPSGALTFDTFLSAENRDIAETKLVEKYVGAINAGRPMVLEGGTKWQQLTINPEDAQMLESRKFSVEEICRFFGVPPHMVGHTSNSTSWGTGLEQQTLGFQKFTLGPRIRRIEQSLSKQLLTAADRANEVTIEFSLEGLLRGDSAGRSAYYQAMTNMGTMTINEVRALENLPPIQGGDVARMQMQNVPIMEAGNVSNL
jgi:HK97 family phage portal protein